MTFEQLSQFPSWMLDPLLKALSFKFSFQFPEEEREGSRQGSSIAMQNKKERVEKLMLF